MDRDDADRLQDRLAAGAHRGGRGRGRGGRSGGGGGGSGSQNRDVVVSKALSKLLRHRAESAGIKLDEEGFAPLDKVLQYAPIRTLSPTLDEVRSLVATNDKQRFTLRLAAASSSSSAEDPAFASSQDPADFLIRANQGHSIRLDSAAHLQPILLSDPASLPDSPVVHGTYFAFWPRIVASGGLRPMSRTHVHFAAGLPPAPPRSAATSAATSADNDNGSPAPPAAAAAAVVSGMRRDAELLVYVDVRRSLEDGALAWWRSDNGVVLCEGTAGGGLVPSRYFAEVVGRQGTGVGVLWRDGERVADLPEGLRVVVPQGKERGGRGRGGRGGGRGGGGDRGRGKGGKVNPEQRE